MCTEIGRLWCHDCHYSTVMHMILETAVYYLLLAPHSYWIRVFSTLYAEIRVSYMYVHVLGVYTLIY